MASMVRDLGRNGGTRVEETHHKIMESAVKGKARLVEPTEALGQTAMIGESQPSHALLGTCSRPWMDIPLNVKGSRIEKIRTYQGPSWITQPGAKRVHGMCDLEMQTSQAIILRPFD